MRRSLLFAVLITVFVFGAIGSAHAVGNFPGYFGQTYSGTTVGNFSCSLCHTSVPALNSTYGQDIFNAGLRGSSSLAQFQAAAHAIDNVDSDGDGATNLAEINASPSTNPADPNSKPAPAPIACTDYTYSAWSPAVCPSSGQQTRTVTGNTPAGCTGTPSTSPILTQACTYVPEPVACTDYTYSAWSPAVCPSSGQQTRTVTGNTPAGCTGTPSTSPVLTQACNYVPTPVACTDYTYSAWSPSVCPESGQQTRTVTGNTPAGCTGAPSTSPVLTQTCNYSPPTPPPSGDAMPVPASKEVFSYDPVNMPVVSSDPAQAEPIGVGPVAEGGDTVDVNIQIGPFDGPVDVSFMIYAPSIDSQHVYFINPHYQLKSLSEAVDEEAQSRISAQSKDDHEGHGMPLIGRIGRIARWKNNVTGVNENLFTLPVDGLPSGVYNLTLIVKSPDDDDNYYRWTTHFTIPNVQDSHGHHGDHEGHDD